jgi:hypothetical protein
LRCEAVLLPLIPRRVMGFEERGFLFTDEELLLFTDLDDFFLLP